MPKAKCTIPQDCPLCPQRIRIGMWMGKDFEHNDWAHIGCLVGKINSKSW